MPYPKFQDAIEAEVWVQFAAAALPTLIKRAYDSPRQFKASETQMREAVATESAHAADDLLNEWRFRTGRSIPTRTT